MRKPRICENNNLEISSRIGDLLGEKSHGEDFKLIDIYYFLNNCYANIWHSGRRTRTRN